MAGGCWGGVGRGVVSAANLLRLLLTVAMFEGHAGNAKLAKKIKKSTENTHDVCSVNVFAFTFVNVAVSIVSAVSVSLCLCAPAICEYNKLKRN